MNIEEDAGVRQPYREKRKTQEEKKEGNGRGYERESGLPDAAGGSGSCGGGHQDYPEMAS